MQAFFFLIAAAAALSPVAYAQEGDPAKAEPIVAKVCAACHGMDGNSTMGVNPSLAGQHPEYLYRQLSDFKSGKRANPVMAGMVTNLSEDDMKNLAAYFAAKTFKPGTARNAALVDEGMKIYRGGIADRHVPACAGCHGPNGAGIPVQFPRLSSQQSSYVATQLAAYRNGERANDGDKAIMRSIAFRMNDADIKAVAEYISGLH